MNPLHNDHPDLLAMAEGRLEQNAYQAAQKHLEGCARCRHNLGQLTVVVGHLNKVIARVKEAYDDPKELAAVVDAAFEPVRAESEFVLNKSDMVYTLSKALHKRLNAKSNLAERLGYAVQTLTGMGREAAEQLSNRIISGTQAPLGAPAVRKNATEVEEDGCGANGDENGSPEKEK